MGPRDRKLRLIHCVDRANAIFRTCPGATRAFDFIDTPSPVASSRSRNRLTPRSEQSRNVQPAATTDTVVLNLSGQAASTPEYAIHEEDRLEWLQARAGALRGETPYPSRHRRRLKGCAWWIDDTPDEDGN
jgi:hypothetical protein